MIFLLCVSLSCDRLVTACSVSLLRADWTHYWTPDQILFPMIVEMRLRDAGHTLFIAWKPVSQESDSVLALFVHRAAKTDVQWEAKIKQDTAQSKETSVPELRLPDSYL